jgi:hypothetical protein
MRQVISAPPTIDVSAFAKKLAGSSAVIHDPSRALCERYGYQTLYEIPLELQKRLRLKLIADHAQALGVTGSVVCDHSVFAWLADWMRWIWGETKSAEWDAVLVAARPAIERSDVIHHVSAGPRAGYDGYRWLDSRNAAQVERLMRFIYDETGCRARVVEASLPKEKVS